MLRPSVNWSLFSAEDVRKTVRMFQEEKSGVRDELGFLAIHQVYADWFFPGTSTQQTRLRYIFFVPWIYLTILKKGRNESVDGQLERMEQRLAHQLCIHYSPHDGQRGIIGRLAAARVAAVPPSISYWTALKQWGITNADRAEIRDQISRHLNERSGRQTDDDGDSFDEPEERFNHMLPHPPAGFLAARSPRANHLPSFKITNDEREFLVNHLKNLKPRGSLPQSTSPDGLHRCLFSKLVERINADKSLAGELPNMPWKLLRGSFAGCLDKQDKEIMRRGKSASSLAYIGRAMYWALVEQRYEEDLQSRKSENTPAPTRHRKELRRVLRSHNGLARALKISDLKNHVPKARNGALFEVLEATQKWIREKGPTFSSWESGWDYSFREIFETAERRRKGSRAKLLRKDERARDNRHAAGIDRLPGASPLLYRWSNVRRFLRDLVNHEEPERQ